MTNVCSRCGAIDTEADEDALPSGWSLASSARGMERVCAQCTRDHVRDIEAKLDEEWWA